MANSIREKIVKDIILKLQDINTVPMGVVKREPMFRDQTEFYNLARTAFPHVIVTAGNETREDLTIGSSKLRQGMLEIEIVCFVKASDKSIDETINDLIEAIEEKLDADRKRDTNAHDTQIIQVQMGEPMEHPYGQFIMRCNVQYTFTAGAL